MKKPMSIALVLAVAMMLNGNVVNAATTELPMDTIADSIEKVTEKVMTIVQTNGNQNIDKEEDTDKEDTDKEQDTEGETVKINDHVYVQPDGKAYVCDEDGNRITQAGTPVIDGKKYYIGDDGYLCKGWLYLGDWKMYFDPNTYEALTGMVEIGERMYLFNADGIMQNIPGTPVIDGEKYWFSTEGWLETGWLYLGDWKMYFDPETYTAKTGMADIDGKKYLFNSDGVMQNFAGTTIIDGEKYWFSDDDASLKTGWLDLNGMKLYFDPETYQAVSGLVQIGEDYYYFNSDCVMCANTTISIDYYKYTFGEDGKLISKEEMTMIWPLPGYTYISSYFGYRNAPTAGASTFHKGIDIPAPAGTPILSCQSGVVTAAGYTSTRGYYVTVDHGNGMSTCYMHMTRYAVSTGQRVSTGQTLGYVGTTGVSTGNHLHLSLLINGVNKDPLDYISRG